MILAAEEHVLGLEDGKRRYINEVTALSKTFAIAIPHDQAMDVKDEVGFFQAVKARLVKFDGTGSGRTDEELETTIRQVIDQALVSEKVIDVYDAAGIKKPDISVLSEEFLLEAERHGAQERSHRGAQEAAERRDQGPRPHQHCAEPLIDGHAGGQHQALPQQDPHRQPR